MSSYYGVIFPEFWTGRTGRELRERGGKDAQLLALYLATNRHANMLGLYRLMVDDVRHETGLTVAAIQKGYQAAQDTNFARFDGGTSFVWVLEMARFRLGVKKGTTLAEDDNRAIAVNRIYHALDGNPFLGAFFEMNHRWLRLKTPRDPIGLVVPFGNHHYPSPLEGASKGLVSQIQRSESDPEIRSRDQKKARRVPHSASTDDTPADNARVIQALVQHLVDDAEPGAGYADLVDLAKTECAKKHIAYDSETVGSALEQAFARKERAS